MVKKTYKWLLFFLLGIIVSIGTIYGYLAWSAGEPAADRVFFQQKEVRPLVIAHPGGAGLYPENTLFALSSR